MQTAPETTPTAELRPTFFDRLATFFTATSERQRLWSWLAPALVTLFAAILRLANLGHPATLVFDETYYVKDAWTLVNLGYESQWPDEPNGQFESGESDIYKTDASFVVHPPLGKWLIGLGMLVFGPGNPVGWRFAVAIAGTITVLLVILLTRTLTRSMAWGVLAGFLLAIDGLGISMSHVALLDGILSMFLVLGVWFIVLDRERTVTQIAQACLEKHREGKVVWGPLLVRRPWLIAAGAAFGAACGVKWSAMWVLAVFGVYLIVTDAIARRRAGVRDWFAAAVIQQGPLTFLLYVPIAGLVYLATWIGWLTTSGGYDRGSDPNALVALYKYHQAILNFHVGLTSGHTYASPAWEWPLMLRPTAMFWSNTPYGENGCEFASGCAQAITSISNPAIWYAGVIAVFALLIGFITPPVKGRFRDWRDAVVLTAVGATFVPWLLFPERTIFQFYTVAIVPYLCVAIVLVLRFVIAKPGATRRRKLVGQWSVAGYVILAFLVFLFWLPLWTGITVPYDFWRLHTPLTSWI